MSKAGTVTNNLVKIIAYILLVLMVAALAGGLIY